MDNYVALWNEPDDDTRRQLIRELWAPDGYQVLMDPPEEVRAAAVQLAFPVPPMAVHGYDALEARVRRAYEMFVEPGEYVFRVRGEVVRLLPNVVAVTWEMASPTTGEVAGAGLDVLTLNEQGRIRADHQYIG